MVRQEILAKAHSLGAVSGLVVYLQVFLNKGNMLMFQMGIPLQFAFKTKNPSVCLCVGIAKSFSMGLHWQANGVSARGKTIEVFDKMILTLQLILAGHYDCPNFRLPKVA